MHPAFVFVAQAALQVERRRDPGGAAELMGWARCAGVSHCSHRVNAVSTTTTTLKIGQKAAFAFGFGIHERVKRHARARHVILIFLAEDRERYSAIAPNSGTRVDAASTQSKPLSELLDRERSRLAHNSSSPPPALLVPKTATCHSLAIWLHSAQLQENNCKRDA